jgi:hypothetical protein
VRGVERVGEWRGGSWPWRALMAVLGPALEIGFLIGAGLALYDGDALVASLMLSSLVLVWRFVPCPREVAHWVLAVSMVLAYQAGEMAVFFLAAWMAIPRIYLLLYLLQGRREASAWEGFFVGPLRFARWSAAAYAWRRRGCGAHVGAWGVALGFAIAWTGGMLWAAWVWSSNWRWPYLAILAALAAWWVALGVREIRRRALRRRGVPPGLRRGEAAGAPAAWGRRAPDDWVQASDGSVGLDFASGFSGQADVRLRLFAADCAEHLLLGDAGREIDALVLRRITFTIHAARRRANGDKRGLHLRLAFAGAGGDLVDAGSRVSRKGGDAQAVAVTEAAARAAFHALCAPSPGEDAKYASNSAAVATDGQVREAEHAWQVIALERRRSQ